MSGDRPEWVTVAVIVAPRGVRGEVAVVPQTRHFERFEALRQVTLFSKEEVARETGGATVAGTPYAVESAWQHGARIVLKFAGIDSMDDAQPLRGAEVRVPFTERAPLPEGEYYQTDLVGCTVVNQATGEPVGEVAGWKEYGGPDHMEVRKPDGKLVLVPFVKAICPVVDLEGRRIVADLPEGLLDL